MYTGERMLKSNYDHLRRRKEFKEGRDLTLKVVAAETGVSVSTLQRVKKSEIRNITVEVLDKLCGYFEAKTLCELLEYVPDPPETTERAEGG